MVIVLGQRTKPPLTSELPTSIKRKLYCQKIAKNSLQCVPTTILEEHMIISCRLVLRCYSGHGQGL